MLLEDMLGRTIPLTIRRIEPGSALLCAEHGPDAELLPLSLAELPDDARPGDELEAFVYLDSEDRPAATLRRPLLELHDVAFVTVCDVNRYGAFVDIGLPKELLVPFAEQTRDLEVGDRIPVGLVIDRSTRLCGTMRIRELLTEGGDFRVDEWVEGEAWRKEPGIGVFAILERRFVGLLPESEPHRLVRGEATRFRIVHVHSDGKVELSLRGAGHEELADDARNILAKLEEPGCPPISDRADPAEIRALFGLSKKAFKRAVGRLLKEGAVELDANGEIRVR